MTSDVSRWRHQGDSTINKLQQMVKTSSDPTFCDHNQAANPITIKKSEKISSTNSMSLAIVVIGHDRKTKAHGHAKWWIEHPPLKFLQVSKKKCKFATAKNLLPKAEETLEFSH